MQFRYSATLIAAAVAGGALYYNVGQNPLRADSARGPLTASDVYSSSPLATGPSKASADAASQSTRKALVVEDGQLYSGTVVGDGPLSKDTDDYGRKVLEMLTPEQATLKLRKNEESWLVGRGKGVLRYDVVQIPSNDPIEDDHAEKIIQVPDTVAATEDGTSNSDWMFWGVYDGHRYIQTTHTEDKIMLIPDSGWTTSAKLRQTLISFVARELNSTYMAALKNAALKLPSAEAIDSAIKQGFIRLDNEIIYDSVTKVDQSKSKRLAAELLAPALSGSCALLSFYDSNSKLLRVACTGDSRAVLGRKGPNGKWTAIPLSVDQTGANEEEAQRMRGEHPGEPNVVMNGRVLGGLEPTRAFGDAVYKWTLETQDKLKKSYFGRTPSKLLRTPPYVTAEPIVTTTKIQPENGDFVVMATDGLWEMLTNEEVIGLVGRWLEVQTKEKAQGSSNSMASAADSWLRSWWSQKGSALPVEYSEGEQAYGKAPIRRAQWGMDENHDRFVVEDKNIATHLVRNALGGRDMEQVCALLTLPSPFARRYR
jgi:pyruvate dehydrogenase phosphatase